MLNKIIQWVRFKKMARHLRKPSGAFGIQVGEMMNKSNEIQYDFTLDIMQPGYDEYILEIGFGNGEFFEKLITRAEGLTLTGIDYSETMVETAQKKNAALINEGRLVLQIGNSDQLSFPDNSFDKVFCINVAYFWDKPDDHLKEIYRVLKPGGKFYTTIRTRESMRFMPFTRFGFASYSVAEWKTLLDQHKFQFISVNTLDEPTSQFNGKTIRFQSICMAAKK